MTSDVILRADWLTVCTDRVMEWRRTKWAGRVARLDEDGGFMSLGKSHRRFEATFCTRLQCSRFPGGITKI
jgi:hypothetical protein